MQTVCPLNQKHEKYNITQDALTSKIALDTIQKIDDRHYSVIIVDLYDTSVGSPFLVPIKSRIFSCYNQSYGA